MMEEGAMHSACKGHVKPLCQKLLPLLRHIPNTQGLVRGTSVDRDPKSPSPPAFMDVTSTSIQACGRRPG